MLHPMTSRIRRAANQFCSPEACTVLTWRRYHVRTQALRLTLETGDDEREGNRFHGVTEPERRAKPQRLFDFVSERWRG